MWAYAAFAWSLVFSAVSFAWAAGADLGAGTVAADRSALGWGAEPAGLAVVGALKLLGCVLAVALARHGRLRAVRLAGWAAAIGLLGYGAANALDHLAMVTGLRDTPEALGETAARWHLTLWDPFWVLGGLLFLLATLAARRHRA